MGSSMEFMIEVQQRASGNAVSQIDQLMSSLDIASNKYKQLESAALSAQKRLDAHMPKMDSAKLDLANATKSGDQAAMASAASALQKLSAQEDQLKVHAAGAQMALHKQGAELGSLANHVGDLKKQENAMADAEKKANALGGQAKRLGGAFMGLPGPLGRVGGGISNTVGRFEDLESVFGTTGAAAAVGTVGLAALTAALIAGAAAALKYSLSMADAHRDTMLTAGAIADGNQDVGASFQSIENETGATSARLLDLERSLKDAGVSAKEMPAALRAISEQETALGDTGGTQKLIDKLKTGQETVGQLSDEMDSKFGSTLEKKMLGVDRQIARLENGFGNMFSTLDIDPFLKGLKTIVDLFDSDTEAGAQMQETFRSIFQPLLDGATEAFPSIRHGILLAENAIVKLEVALDPFAVKIRDAFKSESLSDFVGALTGSELALGVIKTQLEAVMTSIKEFSKLTKDVSWKLPSGPEGGTPKLGNLTGDAQGLPAAFQAIGLNTATGLAAGIDMGAGSVHAAIQGMSSDSISAAREAFQQHSPSKLFEHIGLMNMAGLEIGHEKGANDVEAGFERLANVPSASAAGRTSGGRSVVFNEGAIKIEITGGSDPEEIAEQAREAVRNALEEAGLELGADIFGDEEDAA